MERLNANRERSVLARGAPCFIALVLACVAQSCGGGSSPPVDAAQGIDVSDAIEPVADVTPANDGMDAVSTPHLPLVQVADVPLPGRATRWDYQEIDRANGHLVIAHMGDNTVVVVSLADGSTLAQIPNVDLVRGIAVANSVNRVFASAATTNQIVAIDATTLTEVGRATSGAAPDGIAWDPSHQVLGVSDQGAGAMSLLPGGTMSGPAVTLGTDTGNVVYDAARNELWITVVRASPPDQLVAIDPSNDNVVTRIDLPGCSGAHGLRFEPSDPQTAFVACEDNAQLLRVDIASASVLATAPTGQVPDVMAIDEALGWLYVASESGDLTVFDINQPGLVTIDSEHPDDTAHSVAVDSLTHRVFFPLVSGPNGTPVLRIMRPQGA